MTITYATEPLNIRKAENLCFPPLLKHSDRISGSKVMKHLRTIVNFSRGRLSQSLRVKSIGCNLDIFIRWKNVVLQILEMWFSK